MLSTRNFLFILLLIAAFTLSGFSAYIVYNRKSNAVLSEVGKPDAYMEDVVATMIDKQGKPTVKIVSPKMTHYLENDTTEIIKPLLTLYRTSHQKSPPKPWHLSANHAKALQGINRIFLWENVIIHHPGDEQDEKTTLKTLTLDVYPEKQTATTEDPVVIIQPNSKVEALGMNADLASGAVKLLSQTRGEYRVED